MEITVTLVKNLIEEQFPEFAHLSVIPVPLSGHDNRTFRLGEEMLVRLPSAEGYVRQVEKEHKWLPLLAPHLPLPIPESIVMGKSSKDYPWIWSIYKWLDGESANSLHLNDESLKYYSNRACPFFKRIA